MQGMGYLHMRGWNRPVQNVGNYACDRFHPWSPAIHSPLKFLDCSMVKTAFSWASCYAPEHSQLHQIVLVRWGSLLKTPHILWCSCITPLLFVQFISLDCNYTVLDPLRYITRMTIPMTEVIFLDSKSILFFAFSIVFSGLNTDIIEEHTAPITCSSFCVSLMLNKCWGVLASPFASSFPGTVVLEMQVHVFSLARKHSRKITKILHVSHVFKTRIK